MDFQHNVKTFVASENNDGSLHISYSGSCVLLPKIDFNALLQFKTNSEKSLNLLNQSLNRIEKQNEVLNNLRGALETAKEDIVDDYLTSHRGGYVKLGCGKRADAEILARAIHGATIEELLKGRYTYDKLGHKKVYERRKIFSALSVKKPEDYERITSLYSAFPEVFDCTVEELFAWFKKRYEKGGKKQ